MTVGNNPTTDRSKLGTKRHILTDKNGIPLSIIITPASTHDIKAVTDVIDDAVIKRPFVLNKPKEGIRRRWKYQHLSLDKAYSSKTIENEMIKRGYVPHIPYKRKRGGQSKMVGQQINYQTAKNKRWVVERTNS